MPQCGTICQQVIEKRFGGKYAAGPRAGVFGAASGWSPEKVARVA